jgi:hypothetical protein
MHTPGILVIVAHAKALLYLEPDRSNSAVLIRFIYMSCSTTIELTA